MAIRATETSAVFVFRRSALWLGCAILTVAFVAAEELAGSPTGRVSAAGATESAPAVAVLPSLILDLPAGAFEPEDGLIVDASVLLGAGTGGARRSSADGDRSPAPVPRRTRRVHRVTAYCDVGLTAAGVRSGVGQCAAPENIPFGARVYIPALRRSFIVTDRTDRRFRRNTVDVFLPSEAQCRQFGRRYLECEITWPDETPRYGKVRVPAARG